MLLLLSFILVQDYSLGPGDLIEVQVMDLEEINGDYRVDSQGNIVMPYLDQVSVLNLTSQQLQEQITQGLKANVLNNPKVIVRVKEHRSKPISVIGAVKKPGRIPDNLNIDLLGAITQAGGVSDNAGNRVFIMRRASNGRTSTLEINLDELLYQGKQHLNPPLFPGDTVNIPVDIPISVFITGEVVRPGEYQFSQKQKVTLLQVISKAGGVTDFAKEKKVSVKREVGGKLTEHILNVKAIKSGKKPDFEVLANDIIIVP